MSERTLTHRTAETSVDDLPTRSAGTAVLFGRRLDDSDAITLLLDGLSLGVMRAPLTALESGLGHCLAEVCDRFRESHGLHCTLRVDDHVASMRNADAAFLVGVARVALGDVVCDSAEPRATRVVGKAGENTVLSIADRGSGLDLTAATARRARYAQLSGGRDGGSEVEVFSRQGVGTRVRVRVPFARESSEATQSA